MHHAWHNTLRVESQPDPDTIWLYSILNIPPISSMQAVALIRGMIEKYENGSTEANIEYGINLIAGQGAIMSDGTYNPGADCDGFTCASIIAAIFSHIGLPIADLSKWPSTNKNRIWGRAIVCMLQALQASPEHVAKVSSNISGLRLRPEEFAAAAEMPFTSWPVQYSEVQDRADEISSQILKDCGPQPPLGRSFGHCVITYREETARYEEEARVKNATATDEKSNEDLSS